MIDEHLRHNEDIIICPYCGIENSTDDIHESEQLECYSCDKSFWVELDHTVSYSTSCDCKDNSEEHRFNEFKYFDYRSHEGTYGKYKCCLKCDKREVIFNVEEEEDK